ncbi:MAG: TatD family hydrolase [Desulfobulbaceae bacterium]|nr:TatD family hydrolase [Desulfobulbaceae bacterium]
MRMIEPHIHTMVRTTDDYYNMAVAGIVACVEPSFWSGMDRRSVACFEDYWEHMLTVETERARKYGIKHYVMLSLNPKEARNEIAHDVVDAMEKFLDHPAVVGIGEIGFDLITEQEEEIFRRQLQMGNARKMPICIHSPHQNKLKGIERIIEIIEDEGVAQERIVIDHNTEETIELSLQTRCWMGMTVYYVTKLSAERAVAIIGRYGTDRMIVNGSADWGYSDPLAVPKVAMLMRKSGDFPESSIQKIVFENPYNFLNHSENFELDT